MATKKPATTQEMIVQAIKDARRVSSDASDASKKAKDARTALVDMYRKNTAAFKAVIETLEADIKKWINRVLTNGLKSEAQKENDRKARELKSFASITKDQWMEIGKANGWRK